MLATCCKMMIGWENGAVWGVSSPSLPPRHLSPHWDPVSGQQAYSWRLCSACSRLFGQRMSMWCGNKCSACVCGRPAAASSSRRRFRFTCSLSTCAVYQRQADVCRMCATLHSKQICLRDNKLYCTICYIDMNPQTPPAHPHPQQQPCAKLKATPARICWISCDVIFYLKALLLRLSAWVSAGPEPRRNSFAADLDLGLLPSDNYFFCYPSVKVTQGGTWFSTLWGGIWAPLKSANGGEGVFGCEAERPEWFLMVLLNELSS